MSSEDEIKLKFFDMKKIKNSICIFLGRRGTGKSILIKDLLWHHQDIPMVMALSHTDSMTHYYEQFIPPILIHNEYSPEIMEKAFDRQKIALAKEWKDPRLCVIFDDVLSDAKAWAKDKCIKELFYNGRHYKILFLLALQTVSGDISPAFRTNIDFTFILRNNIFRDREVIYKNYAGMFKTREIFERVLDSCTEDNGCLVIDNTTKSNRLEDQVFYYKAEIRNNFKMCSESIWRQSKEECVDNDNTTLRTNSTSYRTRNGNKITVTKY
jgi:hypothetical protein